MKITIDLNVNATELADSIRALGAALAGAGLIPAVPQPVQSQPAQIVQFPQQPVPNQQPQQQAQPAPHVTPPAPPAAAPAAVPTAAQSYTMDQLAVAATTIIDAGRRQEVVQLLAQFGVPSLMALPKEQYGAFATALRSLGAKL